MPLCIAIPWRTLKRTPKQHWERKQAERRNGRIQHHQQCGRTAKRSTKSTASRHRTPRRRRPQSPSRPAEGLTPRTPPPSPQEAAGSAPCPVPRRRALSTQPAPAEPGPARRHRETARTDPASARPLSGASPRPGRWPEGTRRTQPARQRPAALPAALKQPSPTFTALRGPLTSSCRLGMVPPSQPIALLAPPRFRVRFPPDWLQHFRRSKALPACPECVIAAP